MCVRLSVRYRLRNGSTDRSEIFSANFGWTLHSIYIHKTRILYMCLSVSYRLRNSLTDRSEVFCASFGWTLHRIKDTSRSYPFKQWRTVTNFRSAAPQKNLINFGHLISFGHFKISGHLISLVSASILTLNVIR